ncbi:uncharacterized protein LOC111019527 [Momordica charantia]|uniref:Uncharacterized protein LOC111019527 n=1 Tax=Momordica charantia TaxID=3673 RepID=A0A6J1DCM8_MOMCH|nr:uncharacterized protein LOC111019527 [Momordica charantia]
MAASVCISDCIDNTCVVPAGRPTHVRLHRWPESDAEFVRRRPREVNGISRRQMYLRSYTFSREETVPERTQKCFRKVRPRRRAEEIAAVPRRKSRCLTAVTGAAFLSVFRRLLCCVAKLDGRRNKRQL